MSFTNALLWCYAILGMIFRFLAIRYIVKTGQVAEVDNREFNELLISYYVHYKRSKHCL